MKAVENCSSNDKSFQDLNLDGLENNFELFSDSMDFLEHPLCVPQDPIEDLEWYPNFDDNLISSNSLGLELELNSSKNEFQYLATPKEQKFELAEKSFGFESRRREDSSKIALEQLNIEDKVLQELSLQNNGFGRFRGGFAKKARTKRTYSCGKPKSLMGSKNIETSRHFTMAKRRCKHCETEETPQWRNGLLGQKTLCNTCGVRHKSGRLVPEYKLTISPNFDKKKHSNFHTKVLKKRAFEDI